MRSLLSAIAVALVILASCSSAPEQLPPDVQLTVDMKEYSVTLSAASLKAGPTKIGIRNVGTMEHEFELIKTDVAFDKLPTDVGSGKAKEDGLVKQVKVIQPNRVATVTADLQPGNYVIICNVAGHYQLGMRAALKVE